MISFLIGLVCLACQVGDSSTRAVPTEVQHCQAPQGMDPTGSVDVTNSLNDLFRTIPNGSVICFPSGAQYRVEGTLVLENKRDITIEGGGATFLTTTDGRQIIPPRNLAHKWPRKRSHWLISNVHNLVLHSVNIVGPSDAKGYTAAFEGQHAIKLEGVVGAELHGIRIANVFGDFVYLGNKDGQWSDNIAIHDNRFENSGRQGIAITAANNVLIQENYISGVGRSVFDLEPNGPTGGATNIQIRRNEIGTAANNFLSAAGRGPLIKDIVVDGNVSERRLRIKVKAADGSRRGPITITANTSSESFGTNVPVMWFVRIDGLLVEGNIQPVDARREMIGVVAVESCQVVIRNNQFIGARQEQEVEPYTC